MHRFYVPGSRCIGGRFVTLTRKPGPYEDGGVLAEPTVIRGVAIPAGSELFVDLDYHHVEVRLHAPLTVRGVPLAAGMVLRFGSRSWMPPKLPLFALPLVLLLMPWLIFRARRAARDVDVLRDGRILFVIHLRNTRAE